MPYYNSIDPTEQYRNSNFDPLTGRLQGGNMVLEFLARLAGNKEQKKKEQWEMEDRSSEMEMRKLQQTQAEQGIAMNQRKIQDYQKPVSPAAQFFMDAAGAKAAAQQREKEIKLQGEQARLTATARGSAADKETQRASIALRKQYLLAKDRIETNFSKELADIEKQHTDKIAAIRKDKNLTTIGESTDPNPYMIALRGELAAKERMKKEVAARKAAELEQLEKSYSSGQIAVSQAVNAKDEFGYVVGEEQDFPEGRFKYIGKNQWQQVR